MPNKEMTYAYYLLGTNDVERFKRELSNMAGSEVSFGTVDIGKKHFIVMGITSEVNKVGWAIRGAALGGVLVVGLATFGVGTAGFAAILVGELAMGGVGAGVAEISDMISPRISAITREGDGVKNKFMAPTIIEANSEEFKSLNCEEVLTTA